MPGPSPQLVRHRSPRRSFDLVLRGPPAGLAPYLRGYQGFDERAAAPVVRREVATSRGVLILDLGDGWRVDGERHGSFAAGLADGPSVVAHDGFARCLQVDLTPLGVRTLLGVPPGELAGRVVELSDLLGRGGGLLLERLAGAPTWPDRFAILDELLARRASDAPPPRADVVRAWRRLHDSAGALRVEDLAAELRCSRRHLARRFAHDIGLPPKRVARILRFERAAGLLLDPRGPALADVARRCGFSDQAHLTRDVRALAGLPPAALRASVLEGGGGVGVEPAVPFVQDDAARAA